MGIFAALLPGQKIKKLLGIRLYVAFMGACGILSMYMPFIRLKTFHILLSSLLIGFCLGLERWLMNYFAAVSSDGESNTSVKFGYYNCGLLAGLTIGGALGGIISYVKSCRYIYFAGGIILLAVYTIAFFCYAPFIYWKMNKCMYTALMRAGQHMPQTIYMYDLNNLFDSSTYKNSMAEAGFCSVKYCSPN